MMRRIPSAEIFRFAFLAGIIGFVTTGVTASDGDLAAFLARNAFRTASPMRFRVDADIFFRAGLFDSDVGAAVGSLMPPVSWLRVPQFACRYEAFVVQTPRWRRPEFQL